nr:MAG TPA: hypothetical protein [Caudoviricetes sp.]
MVFIFRTARSAAVYAIYPTYTQLKKSIQAIKFSLLTSILISINLPYIKQKSNFKF